MSGAREEEWPPKSAVTTPYYLRKGPSGSVTSMNDGGLSTEQARRPSEAATSYTYPDWEWVNGVAIIGPDGRVDPARRVLTFTSAPLDGRSRGHRADRAQAVRVVDRDRHPVHRQAHRPASAGRRGAEGGAQPGYTPVSKGWLKASHREKDPQALDADAAVLHPHQSAAAHARRDLRVRHRGAADLLRVQEGAPHPARARQRRFARDRRRVLASLSSDADGHRHHPSRCRACLVPHAAGGWVAAVTRPSVSNRGWRCRSVRIAGAGWRCSPRRSTASG